MRKKTLERTVKVWEYKLPVKVEPCSRGYFAYCPTWKDCYAQAANLEEVLLEIGQVARALIEICQEEGLKIPLKVDREIRLAESFTIPVLAVA